MEAELHRAGKKRKFQGIQQRLAHAEEATTANSAVHALLMTLLAKGIISGVLTHEFARAAQEDLRGARGGLVYPDLEKLANLAQGRNLLRSVFGQLKNRHHCRSLRRFQCHIPMVGKTHSSYFRMNGSQPCLKMITIGEELSVRTRTACVISGTPGKIIRQCCDIQ